MAERACHRAGLDDTMFAAAARDFDVAHYERFAGQRFRSKEAAIFHYLVTGSVQGWEPRADFSPAYYRRANPDIVFAGYEPFAQEVPGEQRSEQRHLWLRSGSLSPSR